MNKEATIIINGKELTHGESMTVRVAIENFCTDLSDNGLGDDEMGVKMTEAYLYNIKKIRNLIFKDIT
jgi:hypothetical protein